MKEGESLGSTELIGYIRRYDDSGQFLGADEVQYTRPDWDQETSRGGVSVPVGQIAKGAIKVLKWYNIGNAVKTLIENENSPTLKRQLAAICRRRYQLRPA